MRFLEEKNFLLQIFNDVVSLENTKDSLENILDIKGEFEEFLLYEEAKVQDSYSFRMLRRARVLASYLIDDKGKVDEDRLDLLLFLLEDNAGLFFPKGVCDRQNLKHIHYVLQKLKKDKSFFALFQKCTPPLCHSWAEELILVTLQKDGHHGIFEADVKRAVLSACFTMLRQNVGSCFATAPAIFIQQHQVEVLLSDLYELLMTGKLKKVWQAKEISVPLSPSMGGGDLYKRVFLTSTLHLSPGLLRALESALIIGKEIPLKEKQDILRNLLEKVFSQEKKAFLQVDELLRKMLLVHHHLEEEDLLRYQEQQKAFIKSHVFTSRVTKEVLSSKNALCQKVLSIEKKAKAAFISCTDHALLKAWEFTLASFSESKMEFSSWNLYLGLGLDPNEPSGIGALIYEILQKDLDQDQKKMREYEKEYQIAYDQVRATELLLSNASSESDVRRLQAELSSRVYHMRACLDLRDRCYESATECSHFFSFLLEQYHEKFPEYFGEIYDADLKDVQSKEYEDAPAGFRLVYKHGRVNAFLWSMIYTAEEYVEALIDFFLLTESQIAANSSWKKAPDILKDIVAKIISYLREPAFIQFSSERVLKIHAERGEIGTPWAYRSGGSMATLLQIYYRKDTPMTEERKSIESETDLLIFLLDTMKNLPLALEARKQLMTSPSHAFTLIPELPFFSKGWEDDLFTYTWVRDKAILPRKNFYEKMILSVSEQTFLLEEFSERFPREIGHLFSRIVKEEELSLPSFFEKVLAQMPVAALEDLWNAFLYKTTPLLPGEKWKDAVRKILSPLALTKLDTCLDLYPEQYIGYIGSSKLQDIAKAFYLLSQGSISGSLDLHQMVANRASEEGLAPPEPLLFADTNWAQFYFGFIIAPKSNGLKLWRMEPFHGECFPMSSWDSFFTKEHGGSWHVFTRPSEYTPMVEGYGKRL